MRARGQHWTCAVALFVLSVTGSANAAPIYTFGSAGATGAVGPTQGDVNAAYTATTLDGMVTVTGSGIQTWAVPFTGTWLVTAAGALGASGDTGFVGGSGALLTGEFSFSAGTILQVAVGQMGLGQDSASNGGGGGGSFVVDALNNPLMVAGGGGGTRTSVLQNGIDGQDSVYGTFGSGSSPTNPGAPNIGGLGLGGGVSAGSWGSGGAGFFGDGGDDSLYGTGGKSWANGLVGGSVGSSVVGIDAQGGFGGGGAGNGGYGGGGGGGYSGGEGGRVAGGAGSYNLGANPTAIAGANFGDGYVIFELLTAQVPEPSTLALVASGLIAAGFGIASRRRSRQRNH